MAKNTLEKLRSDYEDLFGTIQVTTAKRPAAEAIVHAIANNRAVYEAIMLETGVPWQVVGCIHSLEASLNLKHHLHNGDPLTARTTHVPAGRPKKGNPPFTFAESAIDALTMVGLAGQNEWGVAETLFRLEKYNGFGSRNKGINTPYLWSFSNHYKKGKFVKDGVWDANAVSGQCGAAVLIKVMIDEGMFSFEALPKPLSATLNGAAAPEIGVFLQKGNTWLTPRPLASKVAGLAVLSVNPSPFEIVMQFEHPDGSVTTQRFPARLISGAGYVDASDLVRGLMRWNLSLNGQVLAIDRP